MSQTTLHCGFTFWYMRRGKQGAGKKETEGGTAPPATNAIDSSTNNNTIVSNNNTATSPEAEPSTGAAAAATAAHTYENSIKHISTCHTIEEFWSIYNYLVRPNDLPSTTDYHFFRHGIKPTWEDPANVRGGKWIVRLRKGLASRYWEECMLALIGGQFPGVAPGEVCGCVISLRYSEDILGIWNKTAQDRETTERLRESIKRVLQLPPHAPMEYKPHHASLQDKSSFRNTQVWKSSIKSDSGREITRRSGSWSERDGGRPIRRDSDRAWR